jgi:hypothetical protein
VKNYEKKNKKEKRNWEREEGWEDIYPSSLEKPPKVKEKPHKGGRKTLLFLERGLSLSRERERQGFTMIFKHEKC